MNYEKIRSNLIRKFKLLYGEHPYGTKNPHKELLEHHHIRHVHEGGSDEPYNMVWLPFTVHRLLHKLDSKIDPTLAKRYTTSMMYGHTEESRELCKILGGKAAGKKNAESGHMKRIAGLGGKANVESGHIYTIATEESRMKGAKASVATHGPQMANGGRAAVESGRIYTIATFESRSKGGSAGIATLISNDPDHQSKAGKRGAKRSNSQVISMLDGKITTRASSGYWNKKNSDYVGTWVQL